MSNDRNSRQVTICIMVHIIQITERLQKQKFTARLLSKVVVVHMCVVMTMGGTDAPVTASTKARVNSSDSSTKAGTTKGNSASKTCGGAENGCSRDNRSSSYC